MNSYRYILRYALDPSNCPEEGIRKLLEFVEEAEAEEVMFLIAPEERSCGHITKEEALPWVELIGKAKAELKRKGVEISLNPWTTTYHVGRGRKLHAGQNFRLMVGETGESNGITVCPSCEQWQNYLVDYFLYLAEELEPSAIWVEDDWRLHNHGELMGYGGCFCRDCMERFKRRAGKAVSREELIAAITAPGRPHPWRGLWLDLAREALLAPAEKLASAMRARAPGVRLGLMSSIPDVHSIEGRNWPSLMQTLSGENRYLIRPHMPPYTETPPISTPPAFTRHTLASLDRESDIYPELENSPRSGQYSGSHSFSVWEMFNAAMCGAGGITINHFDNMGMNTYCDRGLARALGEAKPKLNALASLGIRDRNARGVQILFSPDAARYTESAETGTLNSLYCKSILWSRVFYVLGISHGFTQAVSEDTSVVYAVSDQTARALSAQQIEALLKHPLILDFPSVQILSERGYGSLIGVNGLSEAALSETAYSYEEINRDIWAAISPEILKARMNAQRCSDPLGVFEPASDARVLSSVCRADGTSLFPGALLYNNAAGGCVFCLPYRLDYPSFYMSFFSRVRQEFFLYILKELGRRGSGITAAGGHPLHLHSVNTDRGIFIGVTNVIYDTAFGFTLHVREEEIQGKRFLIIDSEGCRQDAAPEIAVQNGWAEIRIKQTVKTLETCCLLIEE